MCWVRGPSACHRNNLGEGINRQPEPQDLLGAAEPGAQFVQLEMRKVEVAERTLMEDLRMAACTSEPGGNGGLSVAENSRSRGRIQPFGKSPRGQRQPAEMGFSDGTGECVAWK
jgi:hypothetical protein